MFTILQLQYGLFASISVQYRAFTEYDFFAKYKDLFCIGLVSLLDELDELVEVELSVAVVHGPDHLLHLLPGHNPTAADVQVAHHEPGISAVRMY